VRSALFCDTTQHRVVIPYWHFGTTYWPNLQRSRNPKGIVAQLLARDTIHFDIFLISSEIKLMKGFFGGYGGGGF